MPTQAGALFDSALLARSATRGDIRLGLCGECGYIGNSMFQAELVDYRRAYDLSLFSSPRYRAFALATADELRTRFSLASGRVIEIGAGDGEFLQYLCGDDCEGIGLDPSAHRSERVVSERIRLVTQFFEESPEAVGGDLYICRHVLEHVPAPRIFVELLRRCIGVRRGVPVYFEVPNMEWILDSTRIWNVGYEHCSYFNEAALKWLFSACGFEVLDVREVFGRQYLAVVAVSGRPLRMRQEADVEALEASIRHCARLYQNAVVDWRIAAAAMVCERRSIGWCAGARAVALFNALGIEAHVKSIVDSNLARVGTFLPGTGQEIVSEAKAKELRPDVVIVTNETFLEDIRGRLASMGLSPELATFSM